MRAKDPADLINSFPSFFDDEFHKLRDAIAAPDSRGGRPKVLQFTSAQFDEGVTSVTLGFGVFLGTIYGQDSILAVEANFRRPSFRKTFGLTPADGLQAVLGQQTQAAKAIQRVSSQVSVLPADGTQNGGDLLSSKPFRGRLRSLLAEMGNQYRFVLVDTPPVLPFADARVLSGFVDAVIVVVEANRTRAEQINDALDGLRSAGADILGIILNKRDFHVPNYVYRFL